MMNWGSGGVQNMMGMMGFMGFGMLMWLVVVAAVIGVVVYFVIRTTRRDSTFSGIRSSHREPMDILRERYAKGEIDRDTYERMKNDLR